MKINEAICPTCGLRAFTNCAYLTCDGCQTFFYLSQGGHRNPPPPTIDATWRVLDGEMHRILLGSGRF